MFTDDDGHFGGIRVKPNLIQPDQVRHRLRMGLYNQQQAAYKKLEA
jgi:hypothetical protein